MPDREPEPCESGAAGPFLWIEGSPVEVWALGEDRFAVRAPGHEQHVTGLEEAQQAGMRWLSGWDSWWHRWVRAAARHATGSVPSSPGRSDQLL